MNWRATITKPTEVGYFQSASADFVEVAQHFNAGRDFNGQKFVLSFLILSLTLLIARQ